MKLDNCDNLISEGISYACINIKVYCKDCEHNDYLSCKRFPARQIANNYTSDRQCRYAYKSELNPDGKCSYYKTKTNFINKLIKKLWKKKKCKMWI